MKKGFTLIELLAVIIILAVISLIATPIVLDVIEDAKKSAAMSSTAMVKETAELYYVEEFMKNNGAFSGYECTFTKDGGCDELQMNGERPDNGTITINKAGVVNGKIEFNGYTHFICNGNVVEEESSDCSVIDYTLIYNITEDGIITGFKTATTTSYLNIIPVVNAYTITSEAQAYLYDKILIIPGYVGDIKVTGIAPNAFSSYDIEEIALLSNEVLTIGENAFPSTLKKLRVSSCLETSYSAYADILELIERKCGTTVPTPGFYSVGDKVTLIDGTTWFVIKNSLASENEIKLLSSLYIHPNLTTEIGPAMFLSEEQGGYQLPYNTTDWYVWETSTLKAYLDGTVKTRLEASLNTTISDITIWGTEEFNVLGCATPKNENDEGYDIGPCEIMEDWFFEMMPSNAWTRVICYSGFSSNPPEIYYDVWGVDVDGFGTRDVVSANKLGARPIITVSKSVISQ